MQQIKHLAIKQINAVKTVLRSGLSLFVRVMPACVYAIRFVCEMFCL